MKRVWDELDLFGLIVVVALLSWCIGDMHDCARQDSCEEHGGIVVDRQQASWRCIGAAPSVRAP